MTFTALAGWAGIGFVVLAIAINAAYLRGRLPMPVGAGSFDEVVAAFAAAADALRKPSVAAPAGWLCTTVFAAGMLSVLWHGETDAAAWALVGFAGVLMQNATFTVVEALRFGLAAAARRDRDSVAGLWGTTTVLFGLNQTFLALALLGFTAAGAHTGFLPTWHAILGYLSAALLFASASLSPYNADGRSTLAPIGLVGWLGWASWIIASGVALIGY
ncbi:hypothetical protein NDR87_00770 [Nocardia sp. CDC159]|uniref:Uncharacterized protein n=1 Tax=Nocardia pulmonis TaxID=2951408 RepID=A0A9X2E432_9NOCA|nr:MULTISPECIES: hypothetical protein [Nocardia]MCM6772455.1 hypothetical protein [Nocardia pulmonis]MCM6784887.1 hypothetical protein [Nocardia sp. CDC159]